MVKMKKEDVDIQYIEKFFNTMKEIEERHSLTDQVIKDILLFSFLGDFGDRFLQTEIHDFFVKKMNEISEYIRKKYLD